MCAVCMSVSEFRADEAMTEAEFSERFVVYMTENAGFEHFSEGLSGGLSVREYALEMVPVYWRDAHYRNEGPEACAQGDIDCWGEDV